MELLNGHTPDVSVFCFLFFEPVCIMNPRQSILTPIFFQVCSLESLGIMEISSHTEYERVQRVITRMVRN
jgi:hypothetical protein